MKDKMTYNMIRVLSTHRGVACFFALFSFSVIPSAIAGPRESCASQIKDRIEELSSSRALVGTEKIPTVRFKDAINGRMPKIKDAPYFEFEVPDGGFVTIVDVSSQKARGNPLIAHALENWNKKTDEVIRQLPKFGSYPPGSVQSLDIPDRTVVVMKTVKSINDGTPEVLGGIRVVFGRNPEEKLPFQKELSDYVRADTAAEPGRLTGSGFSPLMLHFAIRVIHDSREISEVNVHTSKVHEVLYRRSGAKSDDIYKQDDENWVLRFGRMHVRQVIKKTRKVLDISAS